MTHSSSIKSGNEPDVQAGLNRLLDSLAPGRFLCRERKNKGRSAIGKPVDLEICMNSDSPRALIAVEVANLNTTQLVGEVCRLYYDSCALKLLVLGDRNVPKNGQEQCKTLLSKLYGQADTADTPARVVWYNDDKELSKSLSTLLLL